MELVSRDSVTIRRLQDDEEDYLLLLKWLTNHQVLQYIEGPSTQYTWEKVIAKYGPRAKGESHVKPCIIVYDDAPIGYLQFYRLRPDDVVKYGVKRDGVQYGIDIFIGEAEYWNRGIGTTALESILHYLFTLGEAEEIYIEPQTGNDRAIRSYEKCGFQRVKVLKSQELFEGVYRDNQLMRMSSEDFFVS